MSKSMEVDQRKRKSVVMISDTWDGISSQIKKSILEQRSILSQFPPEAAVITSREIVLSLAADCSCKKEAEYSLAQAINEATSIQTVQKRALGRHASSDVTRGGNGGGSRLSTLEAEARSKGFSVKLNTEADLQWVMQAINYGLTMPPENWEIVAHSVHIYCDWLGCLLPAPVQSHGQKGGQQLPHALLAHPVSYAPRLLFALCRFFTPRNVSKTGASDLTDTLFSLLHQSPREPPDPACTGAIKDIVKGIVSASTLQTSTGTGSAVAGEAERWLQKKYIPLVSCIVNRIEQILNTSHLLTGTLWDRLLEFSLAVGFAVLSIPPQIESSAITTSRPFSQSPGLRGMLQLESMIVTMLIRVWLRAMAQHYPTNPYWEGLQELCRVARHRIGSSYVWSRVMVIFTFNLLRPYVIQDLSSPPTIRFTHTDKVSVLLDSPPFSAFQPLMGRQLISDLPSKIQELSWFRLLHIFGNPVDLCYPTEITHTAVFEYFRRSNSASRCRLTAAFLPAIFYHLMRSFSTMVDLFLGISPSLSGSLSTFTGVPQNLFGPLADVAEYFQYASVRSPDTAILAVDLRSPVSIDGRRKISQVDKKTFTEILAPRRFSEKYRGVIEQNASATDLPAKTDSVPVDSAVSTTSLANLVRNAGLSSNVDPQSLAEAWLQSDLLVTCFYNRPKVTSFIKLLGPWLFDAASGMRTVSNTSGNKGTIVSDPSLKVDNISFHVGRAEAMACLCRIFIYARKTQLTFSRLARFYLCLVNALTVDPEVEYVLSTVLFHSPDLLRADLPGSFSLLAVPLFNTVQWILKKPSVICPEYISMVLLRRASLHQLLSMACLSNRLEGVQFQELSSSGSTELAGLSTRALRTKLARILCDFLGYETDTHNLRMLLSAAYTLVLDMISVESSSRSFKTKSLTDGGAEQPLTLETASGLYGILLEKICGCLRKWMNDFAASSFALDVLCGMANAPVPQPDIARCRHCIQSICGFIATQCQREKKDHTRSLHSLIINAFNCLGVWIVAHPYALNDHDTLKAVVETTKLGIFGAESAPTAVQMGSSEENLPMPSAMPFSKRVNEAAEHLLSTLFSTAGSFPPLTGPETVSCCLNEELITQLTKSKISPFQHFVASSFSNSIGLGSLNSDVIISLSEVVGWPTTQVVSSDNDQASSVQLRSLAEPLPVYTFLRDNSGRHLWSWRLRYEPRNGDYNERISGSCSSRTLKPKDMRHSKSCLENCWPKKMTSEAEDPFMPRTVDNIVLVRAEKEMPTLAQSVMSPRAREEVDILKSLINSETNRLNSFVRRIRDERIKNWSSPYPNEGHCKPDQPADRLSSSHLLTCHLGYVPVNSLQPSSNSFRASNDSPPSTTTQNPTNRRPAPSIDGHRIPGTKGVGGTVESVSLIPSALTPLDSTLIRNIDSLLVAGQRSTASLFVFYVKNGQTSLTDVIANMNTWSETPKDLQSFVCSLGWQVDIKHHPGWRGPLRGVLPPTITATSHLSGFDARQKFPSATEFIRSAPDGVENVFYWADASTEVATLCPSNYTNVERKSPEEKCTADDFRAAVLWLESWDDALWSPSWAGKANSGSPAMNPLQSSLVSEFDCSLIILIHPLVNNGLFRIGILRPKEIGHEAGPLTTGLLLSAPLLGSMVRSTLTSTLHRLASDADSAFVTAGEGGTASRRQRLSMAFGSGGEKGKRPASAVELLLWSAERCY